MRVKKNQAMKSAQWPACLIAHTHAQIRITDNFACVLLEKDMIDKCCLHAEEGKTVNYC